MERILEILEGMPEELITVIVAALPIFELRGSIPLALLTLKISPHKAFLLSILGNLMPVVPLLLFLQPLSDRLRRFRLWRGFFDYLFARTRRKATLVERYAALGLALFVAIPLPVTGAWSGCIAATLFKIRFRYAFWAILTGICLAAVIVTFLTIVGGGVFFHLFLGR